MHILLLQSGILLHGKKIVRRTLPVVFLVCVAILSSPTTLFAAPCTNSYTSGASAPVGYAVSWNPLTAARELLVQGTDCTTSTATVKVGSGANTQYVYNKGYYYTGTAWKEYTLTGTSALQSNAWYTGSAQASIQLPQTVTYVVGYVCQQQGSAWKCGCRDSTCSTSYWQLQAVKGAAAEPPSTGGGGTGTGGSTADGGSIPDSEQCAKATPPAHAAAAGLTKLAFCDDFSTDSVARGSSEADRKIRPGKKWTTQNACFGGSNAGGCNAQPAGDFKFNGDGTLSVKPTYNRYQTFMQSVYLDDDGKVLGYWMDSLSKGFLVEVRFKMDRYGGNQPALWTMDLCHWFNGKPSTCASHGQGNIFLEHDFFEYSSGAVMLHQWVHGTKQSRVSCGTGGKKSLGVGAWRLTGWMVTPPGQSKSYADNVQIGQVAPGCSGLKTDLYLTGDYQILMGSRMDDMTFDFVRVWEHPNE